jgi:glutamine amidotransferase-like uncharacterized protein
VATISIYKDDGVNDFVLSATLNMLQSLGHDCDCISAQDIKNSALSGCDLFVMPGGADEPYHAKLGDDGATLICDYVVEGGAYLGLCAGAYYACDCFEFNKGFETEICRDRPLKLFKGWAKGSILEFADAYDLSLDTAAIVTLRDYEGHEFDVYYHGGPVFLGLENDPDVEVIASYSDLPANQNAAILAKNFGKGRVVLSSPHIEVFAQDFEKRLAQENDPQKYINLLNGLENLATERFAFLEKVLGLLVTKS